MKAYLAGPMRGVKDRNLFSFDYYERQLTTLGWSVVNPARRDVESGMAQIPDDQLTREDLSEVLLTDLDLVSECDVVFLLPGWRASRGAITEATFANYLAIPVLDVTGNSVWFTSHSSEVGLLSGLTSYAKRKLAYWADMVRTRNEAREEPPRHSPETQAAIPSNMPESAVAVADALRGDRGPEQAAIAATGIDWILTLLKKNRDYGSSAFKRPILAPNLCPAMGILVRASDKIERIRSLAGKDAEVEESLNDTVKDLGAYCLLWLVAQQLEGGTDAATDASEVTETFDTLEDVCF